MNKLLNAVKYLVLLVVGGIIYYTIETLFRGYSHWSMFVVGGLCLIGCGLINELFSWETPFWLQCIVSSLIITTLEFIAGCIVNLWLGWGVWDYSTMPFNLLGQICLPFSLIWVFLGGLAVVLDDWLRHWLFKEEKPHYRFF